MKEHAVKLSIDAYYQEPHSQKAPREESEL